MRSRRHGFAASGRALLLALLIPAGAAPALATNPTSVAAPLEARVRAAFLFNFARYTQWPTEPQQRAFTFCVVEDAAMRQVLEETVSGKDISGRPPAVQVLQDPQQDLGACQLIYLPQLQDGVRAQWLDRLEGRPVLTVSEGRDFTRQGGMVGFHLVERRLRFAINPGRVNRAGMQMSSRLLGLADIESGGR